MYFPSNKTEMFHPQRSGHFFLTHQYLCFFELLRQYTPQTRVQFHLIPLHCLFLYIAYEYSQEFFLRYL